MNAQRRLALFAASNVDASPAAKEPEPGYRYTRAGLTGLAEGDIEKWFTDPRIRGTEQLPDRFFTKDRKAFDKGHIVRREDVAWGTSFAEVRRANGDTYFVTNCSPQTAGFNRSNRRDNWGALEDLVLKQAKTERYCLFAGPVLKDDDPEFVGVDDLGGIKIRIPRKYWKVIVARDGDSLKTAMDALKTRLRHQIEDLEKAMRTGKRMVVNNNVPAQNVAELAAMLRAKPGEIPYVSTGVGQSTHLSPVLFLQMLNAQAIHVPTRGSAPAQIELLAGNVTFLIDNLTGIMGHIQGGRVRALAVTSKERHPLLPNVPAMRETMPELANYEVNTWFGVFGQAAMPAEMINSINADIMAMLAMPETVKRFEELGGMPMIGSARQFGAFVASEITKWADVIKREGLQIDAS
jgi:tripartite-type tricarboxylate transporter receptor subunit TctC